MPEIAHGAPFAEQPENPSYTFETFVVSEASQEAWAAAIAVTESAGRAPNPLFLLGPVGSGKSHLLHAIAHRMRARRPRAVIRRLAAEAYVLRLVAAIRSDDLLAFRQTLMTVDALLLDDLLLSGEMPATEGELFLRIVELARSDVQVVVTSDARWGDRLRERLARLSLERAAIVETAYPDHAARAEILRRLAVARGLMLSEPFIRDLADRCAGSPRELQSRIARLAAETTLSSRA